MYAGWANYFVCVMVYVRIDLKFALMVSYSVIDVFRVVGLIFMCVMLCMRIIFYLYGVVSIY